MDRDFPSGSSPGSSSFQLGPYEALECLGSGGFASVYRARDLRSGGFVALKVVPPGTDEEAVRRLMREARAVSRLSHPNVVRVYECGVVPDGAYVAMELLEGRTLQDAIDDGPLPLPRALDIALRVLDGLSAAHESRIVHRDVKPGNIFLCRDAGGVEVPRLLDFGVSKMGSGLGTTSQQDRTLPGTAVGTPGYMAPEQYGSAYAADARADVYGMAATVYAMLTGRLPFEAATYESWLMKVKGERAPSLGAQAPHVPPEFARAIDRGLARDPDARWPTAADFSKALLAAAQATARRTGADSFVDVTAPAMLRSSLSATAEPRTPQTPKLLDPPEPVTVPRPPPTPLKKEPVKKESAASSSSSKSGRSKKRRRRSGSGAWFFVGALVGAVLAAVGAGVAFWVRARAPRPPPPTPAPTQIEAPR